MKKLILLSVFIVLILSSIYSANFNVSGVSLWMTRDDVEELGYKLLPFDDVGFFLDSTELKIDSDISDGVKNILMNGRRMFNIAITFDENEEIDFILAGITDNPDLIIVIFDALNNFLWGTYGEPTIVVDGYNIVLSWKSALEHFAVSLTISDEENVPWEIGITLQPSLDYWFKYGMDRSLAY